MTVSRFTANFAIPRCGNILDGVLKEGDPLRPVPQRRPEYR